MGFIVSNAAVAKVSKDVEWAMNENSPYLRKKDDYLAKARQLAFNLKKNEQLRCGIHQPWAIKFHAIGHQ